MSSTKDVGVRPIGLLLILLAVQLAGCATVADTPAQVLAQERWEQCKGTPGVQLKEIRPDGQIWVWTTDSGKAWQECDRRVANEQASRRKVNGPGPAAATTPALSPLPPEGIRGTYSGLFSGTQGGRDFALPITLRVAQEGTRLSGTWTAGNASGTASGTVSGTEIINFRAEQITPCAGTLSGTVGIEDKGSRLRGAFAGQACQGPVAASFVVTRQ